MKVNVARITWVLLVFFWIAAVLPNTGVAAPLLPVCSWPFEVTGRGLSNIATPDTNATYWVMPLDGATWKTMSIRGKYPAARLFNVATYAGTGQFVDSVLDRDIGPDPGSTNPFSGSKAAEPHNYTLTISAAGAGANVLSSAPTRVTFVVYRVYVPDGQFLARQAFDNARQGVDRTGGVGLPAVSVTDGSGNTRDLQPCPFADSEASLTGLVALLRANNLSDAADFLQRLQFMANSPPLVPTHCTPGGNLAVSFAPATLNTDFFPNPITTYLETPSLCLKPGEALVIRGRAAVFPNTYRGGSVFDPAFDTQIQMRYWSMCQNDRAIPYPVVACQPDFATLRDQTGIYTYVVSNDQAAPPWLPMGATWLPWGDITVPKNLIFRLSLPANSSTADFTPSAVFCDVGVLSSEGWQGCFATAGLNTVAGR
jgi:hypothetical protein